jgi:hypothetical protein
VIPRRLSIGALFATALAAGPAARPPAHAAILRAGFWYGEAHRGDGRQWIALRVVRRHAERLVADVTAGYDNPSCTLQVNAERNPRLGPLRVDRHRRFRGAAGDGATVRGGFTRAGLLRGTIQWSAATRRRRGCDPKYASALRFSASSAASGPVRAGRWVGALVAQPSSAGQGIPAQPLGFVVLPNGRFLRTGPLRLDFLVSCPSFEPAPAPVATQQRVTFSADNPFGAVSGRRAIPPHRAFTLVDEPFADGVALAWHLAVDGDRATGWLSAKAIAPAYSCGGAHVAWSARRRR